MTHRLAARHLVTAVVLAAGALAPIVTDAQEGVRIGLTYAAGTRPGLYVLPMTGGLADSIRTIISRDLDFGDRISVIVPDSGVRQPGALNYPLYAQLGAAAVLELSEKMGGVLSVTVHEVGAARVMQQKDFVLDGAPLSAEWRLALHAVSDEVERWVTGVPGVAATRVLFNRAGTLWMVDSDGANARPVPGVGNANYPAWHPSGRMIAYMEQADDGSHILLRDLEANTARRVSFSDGMNATPAFSPDGRSLVFSHGTDGTDLWAVQVQGGDGPRRVTVGRGTDNISPSFSPDGRRIAFASGRLGRPEIYITDADGANPQWLTTTGFGDQSYRSDPSWAPDGRYVAFQTQIEGRFQVATINLRDRSVKQHTIEGINEQPTWAPDARHLVFTSNRSGSRQLWVLDTESGRMRQLTFGAMARQGSWSPRLAVPK
ncbi:MAG: PD40 domain-containing protein [Gemmatimonadaceae bacterium]|nr:PD40 domain-containing protein [Gemmatimonadaceae bacterium]